MIDCDKFGLNGLKPLFYNIFVFWESENIAFGLHLQN